MALIDRVKIAEENFCICSIAKTIEDATSVMTTVCGSPGYVGKDSGTEMLYQMAALTVY
jgi:hypothetical protein